MMSKELFLPIWYKGIVMKVHVIIYGRADAKTQVLCLHGFASSGKVGFGNIARQMRGYNLVAIDWIGYGESSKPLRKEDTYDSGYMVGFLLKFIDEAVKKKILRKKFSILATSMSGIAVALSHQHLQKYVEKMILVNPAGFDRRINIKFSLLLVNPLVRRDGFRRLISGTILKGDLFGWEEDQKRRLAKLIDSEEFKVYLRTVKAAVRPRGRIRNVCRCMDPKSIRIPILMLASRKDTLIRRQRYVKVAKDCGWKFRYIEYDDHALLIYRPKEVAKETKKFLNSD